VLEGSRDRGIVLEQCVAVDDERRGVAHVV
jgi:hypothetical protein